MQTQLEHYNKVAEEYTRARRNPCHRAYVKYLNNELYRCIADKAGAGSHILDPMCGGGELIADLHELTSAELYGIDLSDEMIKRIPPEIKAWAHIAVGDVLDLHQYQEGSFDAVVISGGVHHVHKHIDELFTSIWRVLKPGGKFVYIEPSDDFLPFRIIRRTLYRLHSAFDETEEQGLRSHKVLEKMRSHGFKNAMARPIGYLGYTVFGATDILPWFGRVTNPTIIQAGIGLDRIWSRTPLLRGMSLLAIFTGSK